MVRLCRRNFKSFQAVLILVCNVLLGGAFKLTLTVLLQQPSSSISVSARNVLAGGPTILYIIAGIIADIRFGRYKVISLAASSSASPFYSFLRRPA